MNMRVINLKSILLLTIISSLSASCSGNVASEPFSLDQNKESGRIVMITQENQSTCYVYRENHEIAALEDLNGRTVHVVAGTAQHERVADLHGTGLRTELVPHMETTVEDLIDRVADSEIRITIADTNIVRLNRKYEPRIKTAFSISPPQYPGWAVRKGDDVLLEEINRFFTETKSGGTLDNKYNRYYKDSNRLNTYDLDMFHRRIESRMPRFRPLIKKSAMEHGFDWRLIAAIIYQESHFDPDARSYTGVRGLMQVTQITAREMGIADRTDPEQSIRAGVGYLASLYNRFEEIDNKDERLNFALASYNIGYGHIRDAQNILRKRNRDPGTWVTIKEALPLLHMPEFYQDTRFGYARGTETVRYVENIRTYYEVLKRTV